MSIPTHFELDDADYRAIVELAAGNGDIKAATAAGYCVGTLARRKRNPVFRAYLSDMRAEQLRSQSNTILDQVKPSVDRLAQLRDDPEVRDSTKVRAATALLDYAIRLRSEMEVANRVAELEARIAVLTGEKV